ncbi:putative YLP motif-containing protein [Helianthus annuus]|uniref:YLP motif-containing protein n=1 Tax=Helianthus annuus TaxID=4232 RepID=A0A251VFI6_HELAN|nr:uncharacterized protein LOC110919442 isoform X1 [Helianthus annuus]KAF5818250.1 putative YLP motif-containing protein [Helianthus annuus]
MDHSWRPPAAGNNNIFFCPICSVSHFPFCPPPPLIENPSFHYSQPPYNQPPPFPNHHYPNPNPNPPTNPTFHHHHHHPRPAYVGIKRMKVDHNNNSRGPASSDNERILKLIHDHGNATPSPSSSSSSSVGSMGMGPHHPSDYTTRPRQHPNPNLLPNAVDYHNSQPHYHHYWPNSNPFDGQPPSPPKHPSLFPLTSSADAALFQNPSSLSPAQDFHIRQSSSARDVQPHPSRRFSSEKQHTIDASHIFKQPHRASRPDHFVIILRGLPGSGKSYLAKMLRDIEVENGGEAPRIHSMDEYFMIEVEKAEDSELSKSSGSLRGKRQVMKTVMEYCYEPEMEEAYRASMLKAFKKTLDEGVYSFIIVDDRNLRVADFAQFWATAKRSGYEVYLVEASYKDPAGCAARNVHNFTLPDIQKMAGQWEEAPPLYLKMDIKSLLHGDGLVESDIQEVDMDMEDEDASQESHVKKPHDETKDQVDDFRPHDELKDVTATTHQREEVKDLSRSKWSNSFDAEEDGKNKISGGAGALSGLVQAYSSKEAKSVSWGDQGGNVGFSISATRKTNTRSLVIGPGPGYNLKSNPLSEEEYVKSSQNAVEPRTQSVFQERIRAERESFKAVFDKRRQRIGGFNVDEE